MIASGENELICDFAETYRIYDYKAVPPRQAAILAAGLSNDSRIKRKLRGAKHSTDTLLLAYIADTVNTLLWFQTKDGQSGINRPQSILEMLTKEQKSELATFDTIEAYEAARAKIIGN